MAQHQRQSNVKEHIRLKEPDMYDVVLLNDDFTTMEFVVMVLQKIFFHTEAEAESIMLAVHRSGRGVAGTYTFDIACSQAQATINLARKEGFPLNVEVVPQKQ